MLGQAHRKKPGRGDLIKTSSSGLFGGRCGPELMGSTTSTPQAEEAALPPETKAMSCSVEELQKCLKETGGDRTKCEKEIEEVSIVCASPGPLDFLFLCVVFAAHVPWVSPLDSAPRRNPTTVFISDIRMS